MKINKFFQANPPTPEQQKEMLNKQMREASQAYEKYFLDEMVKAMRSTVPKNEGLIKSNFAEDLYRENLDQEYVKTWSESGGVGLSDLIFDQLKAQIEGFQDQGRAARGPKAYEKQALPIEPLDDQKDLDVEDF